MFVAAMDCPVRTILRSTVPEVRAVASLLFAIPFFLVFRALAYLSMSVATRPTSSRNSTASMPRTTR